MEEKKRLPIVARSPFPDVESTGAVNDGLLIVAKLIRPGASSTHHIVLSTSNQ